MTEEQTKKHLNLRSILYHDLQETFVEDKIMIHPEVETYTTLMEEGSTLLIDWAEGKGNKRKIEAKKLYKKRTGRSPDYLDATMLAWADRVGGPTYGVMFSEPEHGRTINVMELFSPLSLDYTLSGLPG